MTPSQVSGALSGLVGVSVLVAAFRQWWDITADGKMLTHTWVKMMFVVLIALQITAIVFLFAG